MTALAGYWSFGGAGAERACERMLAAQALYGQESAQAADGAVALGRRIFRTLPEDRLDRRPMRGAHGRILAADVRLDNRAELAAALGVDARDLADAELVLRGLERWGDGVVERLVGDFAFACWEPARQRLLLARDFAGQRPLYYHRGEGFFAFASMPAGLHALPQVRRAPDLQAVAASLLALAPGSASFFEGIDRVRRGEAVIVTPSGTQARTWWRPDLSPLPPGSGDDHAERLLELLDGAVAARLRGAGERVGSHLSGGLDSAAVATSAARLLGPVGGRVTAFTAVPRAGYDGSASAGYIADEGPLAAESASLYPNIDHVLVAGGGDEPLGRLDRSFSLSGQPAAHPSNLGWIDAIKDEAKRRGLRVLLVGAFGNLSLSYRGEELLSDLLAGGRWLRLAREIRSMRRLGRRRRSIAALALGPLLPDSVWGAIRRARSLPADVAGISALRPEVVERFVRSGRPPGLIGRRSRRRHETMLAALAAQDPGATRKASLAGWGLDVRDPTADRRLVEFALRVPLDLWQRDGRPRSLARRALAGRLPPAVIDEERRGHQAADWHESLVRAKDRLAEEVERASRSPAASAILDVERLARLVEDMPDLGWESASAIGDYRHALLRGLAAADFIRRASGGND
jgi:asparagine synthase (glutamine-hydrolysing)